MSIGFGKQKDLAALEGRRVSLDGALTILSFVLLLIIVVIPVFMIVYHAFFYQGQFNPELFKKADEKPGKGLGAAMIRTVASPFSALSNYYDSSVSNESLFQVQTDIILKKAAAESCIIVGRCGDYILRNHPNHLRIFIRADYDDRVKFVCEHDGVTPAKARQIIDKNDNQRSEYHNFYSETNWGDSRAYDICVNSSLLGLEGTAEFLLNFARKYLKIQ